MPSSSPSRHRVSPMILGKTYPEYLIYVPTIRVYSHESLVANSSSTYKHTHTLKRKNKLKGTIEYTRADYNGVLPIQKNNTQWRCSTRKKNTTCTTFTKIPFDIFIILLTRTLFSLFRRASLLTLFANGRTIENARGRVEKPDLHHNYSKTEYSCRKR